MYEKSMYLKHKTLLFFWVGIVNKIKSTMKQMQHCYKITPGTLFKNTRCQIVFPFSVKCTIIPDRYTNATKISRWSNGTATVLFTGPTLKLYYLLDVSRIKRIQKGQYYRGRQNIWSQLPHTIGLELRSVTIDTESLKYLWSSG